MLRKITRGFVVQVFDETKNKFVSQEFVAGDIVEYEDENGNPIDEDEIEPYLPFDMVQPSLVSWKSTNTLDLI